MLQIEDLVIKNLITNQSYFDVAIPFLNEEYFEEKTKKYVFRSIKGYFDKFGKRLTKDGLAIAIQNFKGNDNDHTILVNNFSEWTTPEDNPSDLSWLIEQSEQWCRERGVYNTIVSAAVGLEEGEISGDLAEKISEALSVSFDTSCGHDYWEDAESRYDEYTSPVNKIPFSIDTLNRITKGGVEKGTLNILQSSDTGGFKSGTMCQLAAHYMMQGLNVAYISLEMSEKKIAERIDASLIDIEINNLPDMSKDSYLTAIQRLKQKTIGRLFIKQYPTSGAHAGHFRYWLKELKQKKKCKIDVLIVDYINIAASQRLTGGNSISNSYGYVKAITEECRGLMVEFDLIGWSATQSNRGGSENIDLSVTDVSESYAITYTADMIIGIITTEELDAQEKLLLKILKNRYNNNKDKKYVIGVNKAKMQLYDLLNSDFSTGESEDDAKLDTVIRKPEERKKDFKDFKFK